MNEFIDLTIAAFFLSTALWWAVRKIKSMFREPLTVHRETIVRKVEKPRWSTFKNLEWKFKVIDNENGKDRCLDVNVGTVLLQEIRDNQADQTAALEANTKAVNELKAYLMQVFGGVDEAKR